MADKIFSYPLTPGLDHVESRVHNELIVRKFLEHQLRDKKLTKSVKQAKIEKEINSFYVVPAEQIKKELALIEEWNNYVARRHTE